MVAAAESLGANSTDETMQLHELLWYATRSRADGVLVEMSGSERPEIGIHIGVRTAWHRACPATSLQKGGRRKTRKRGQLGVNSAVDGHRSGRRRNMNVLWVR